MTITIPPASASGGESPYRPGFGTTPPVAVGRQAEVNAFARALDQRGERDGPCSSPVSAESARRCFAQHLRGRRRVAAVAHGARTGLARIRRQAHRGEVA
ncbi:hypothetical protein IOD13_03735 [Brevibacterium casei]|nr:hypothetical protein [Brevibacterium casei]